MTTLRLMDQSHPSSSTLSVVPFSRFSDQEGRGGGRSVPNGGPRREDRVMMIPTTISDRTLHKHDLELVNKNKFYVCDGCKEDGNGERFRCSQGDCRSSGPQFHKYCAQPERNRNHPYFDGCCFSLVAPDDKFQPDDLYCNACCTAIKGFFYSFPDRRHQRNVHPWCMHVNPKERVADVTVVLETKLRSECIECGTRRLTTERLDKGGGKEMDSWGYVTEDGKASMHIHCMKKRLGRLWRSGEKEEDLLKRNPCRQSNNSSGSKATSWVLKFLTCCCCCCGCSTCQPKM